MKGSEIATLVLSTFVLSVVCSAVSADAVGILWVTEKEMVNEMSPHCIEYGVYNPSSNDAKVKLTVSDSLKPVVQGEHSIVETILAGTRHENAVKLKLCFQVPKVYEADCLAGDFLCEQDCSQEEVSYTGGVMAVEVNEAGTSGTGSKTTVGASVPLTLRVRCQPYQRDWSPVYLGVAVIAGVAIAGRVYTKKKKRSKKK
jgi:hypothetical protein